MININKSFHCNSVSTYHLYNLGFRYSPYYECHVLVFPVFFYKKIPTVFCRLRLYRLDNIIEYDIINQNQQPIAFYYDREFGNAKDYIRTINFKVYKKLKSLGFIKLNKHVNNKLKGVKG